MLDGVLYSVTLGHAQLDFSRTGTLVYRSGGGSGAVTVQWLDSAGKAQPLRAKPGFYGRPSLSPDGRRLAVELTEGSGPDIWVYEWQRDTMTRVTLGGLSPANPVWSPDGRYIFFLTSQGMSWARADGGGKSQSLTQSKNQQYPWSFTPDGKRLGFMELSSETSWDLWTVPVEVDGAALRAGKPEAFLQTPADERYPSFSPDGHWMAYASNDSGTFQVYVRAFPDKGSRLQISNDGGAYPMWSGSTHELFFEALDNRIMVATYAVKGDALVVDKPRVWSEKRLTNSVNVVRNYDLAPDGKRVAALVPAEATGDQKAEHHVIFLENFFDEVKRRAPAGK